MAPSRSGPPDPQYASLRTVAGLVAGGAASSEVFAAVAREVARVTGSALVQIQRFEPDGTVTVAGAWGAEPHPFQPGTKWSLEGSQIAATIKRTAKPVRIDDFGAGTGPIQAAVRQTRIRGGAGAPIVVDGEVWGAMSAGPAAGAPVPEGLEHRLAEFTELVATAIANAQSREDLARLAEEQAALRRVATLVARESSTADVFGTVAEEVARLIGTAAIGMLRFEADGTATLVAQSATPWDPVPLGTRFTLEGENVIAPVLETGAPVRFDDYEGATGAVSTAARALGIRSSVAVPIVVEGRLWGTMVAAAREPELLPDDTESRLGAFTELVATAISNAQAWTDVRRLADQQAALRRVATLVAQERPAADVFAAVAEEVGRVLHVEDSRIIRYGPGETITVVASWGRLAAEVPVGTRMTAAGENVSTIVLRTGRAARRDRQEDASGPIGNRLKELGVRSAVGAPVIVEGRLWGAMVASSQAADPLPVETEARLAEFTELVATAIANIEARSELAASRARLVAASDAERRRVVRDLHDGAQQRLVHTILTLKLARHGLQEGDESGAALVTEALEQAERANAELRELAHGILPAVLTQGGLRAGVEALASRSPVPVQIDVSVGRLPAAVEATAYFVVAEALTNVAKHSRAGRAEVTARVADGTLEVQVRDDGIGGARSDGSGLVGLGDRLVALGGTLRIESPPGGGTLIAAEIPVAD